MKRRRGRPRSERARKPEVNLGEYLQQRTKRWRESHEGRVTVMSARQYSMGKFFDSMQSRVIGIETLSTLSQMTINSMLIRGYVRQASPTTVHWTKEGSAAVRKFAEEHFDRKPSMHFSQFLSLDVYGGKRENGNKEEQHVT